MQRGERCSNFNAYSEWQQVPLGWAYVLVMSINLLFNVLVVNVAEGWHFWCCTSSSYFNCFIAIRNFLNWDDISLVLWRSCFCSESFSPVDKKIEYLVQTRMMCPLLICFKQDFTRKCNAVASISETSWIPELNLLSLNFHCNDFFTALTIIFM